MDENSNEWRAGPNLPFAVMDGALVEDGKGGVILVGGSDGSKETSNLFRLEHVGKNADWKKMPQKLRKPRSGHVAFLVQDDITTCV